MPLENMELAARRFSRRLEQDSRRLGHGARRLEQGARRLGHLPVKDYKGSVPAVVWIWVA